MIVATNVLGHLPFERIARRAAASGAGQMSLVALIDRRTGATHRIDRRSLAVVTPHPAEAARELLKGRNPDHWEVRIETFPTTELA